MRHRVSSKPNGGGKKFTPGIAQPAETFKPKRTQKVTSREKIAKEKFDCSDPNYFRFVIDEYQRNKNKMSVFNMRENIRIFTSVLFFNGKYHPNKKCRGLWREQKPFKWPQHTPFCDPNNAWDQSIDGKKKPSKDQLAGMIDFLITYYQICDLDGTLKFPPKEPPPNSQPRSHRVRFMLQQKQKQEILRQPVQNSEAHDELPQTMSCVPSTQEQINPGFPFVKTTTDPMEVSGSDSMNKAKELTDIGAIKKKLQEAENYVFELNELSIAHVPNNSSSLKIPITTAYQTTQMQPQSSCDPDFTLSFKKLKDHLPKASPVTSPANPIDLMSNIELRNTSDPKSTSENFIEELLSGNPMMAVDGNVNQEKPMMMDPDFETELATKTLLQYYDGDAWLDSFKDIFTDPGQNDLDSTTLDKMMTITFPEDEQNNTTADINFNVQTQQKDDQIAKRELQHPQNFPQMPIYEAIPPPNVEVQGLPKSDNGELAISVQGSTVTYAGESLMVAQEEIIEEASIDEKQEREKTIEGIPSTAGKPSNVQPVDDICHPIAENIGQDVIVSHEVVISLPEGEVSTPVASSEESVQATNAHPMNQYQQGSDLLTQVCQQSGFEDTGVQHYSPQLFSFSDNALATWVPNNPQIVTMEQSVAAPLSSIQQDVSYRPPLIPGKKRMVVNGKMCLRVPNDVYAPVVHGPVPLLPKPAPPPSFSRNDGILKKCVETMDVEDNPLIPTVVAMFDD